MKWLSRIIFNIEILNTHKYIMDTIKRNLSIKLFLSRSHHRSSNSTVSNLRAFIMIAKRMTKRLRFL